MVALVDPRRSGTSVDASRLSRDYLVFERQRTTRRQYMKAFGGMAILVLLGAAFNRVPRDEALIVAGLLSVPPASLAMVEQLRWRRLVRRLDAARIVARDQKVVKSV